MRYIKLDASKLTVSDIDDDTNTIAIGVPEDDDIDISTPVAEFCGALHSRNIPDDIVARLHDDIFDLVNHELAIHTLKQYIIR